MKVWAIYTQFEPTYKYEEALESLWSTEEKAIKEAKKITVTDHVTVQELTIDSGFMWEEDNKTIKIK